MIRPLVLVTLLLLTALPATAQPPAPTALTLHPMAEPVPALKYHLLPELREQKPGNAALLYYRSLSPEWQWFRHDAKMQIKLDELSEKRLRDLSPAEVARWSVSSWQMLWEVDRAARRAYCDWELTERMREDGIGLLLPELQSLRTVGSLLRLRAKEELLAGKYDKAARTIQTGLALARHTAEGPTLIHGLVGAAIANVMFQVVEDWLERPEAPNLYWALTSLPQPLIDLRTGFQGERLTVDNILPGYREMLADPAAPPASEPVQRSLQRYAGILGLEGGARVTVPLLAVLRTYPAAKRFLRQQGRTAEQVEALSALQAVFLYEVHKYDVNYDDLLKWTRLPYPEAVPQLRRVEERLRAENEVAGGFSLALVLLPALHKVLGSQARLERKVAALRCIEALRLHAAAHGGQLPSRLEDVTEVPFPLDPWTGKAFAYRLEDGKATLAGGPLGDETPSPQNSFRYELTLRPAKGEKPNKAEEAAPPEAKLASTAQAALAPLIEEETFALVRLDLSRVDVEGLLQTLRPLLPTRKDDLAEHGKKAKDLQTAFVRAGGSELLLAFATAELPALSFVQVPLKEGADVPALTRLLKEVLSPRYVVEKRGQTLVAGSRAALSRLAKNKPSVRAELAPALAAAGDAAVQVLLLPTNDQRRVVEEVVVLLLPSSSVRTLTQGVRWAALGLDVGPKPALKLTLHAADGVAARKLADLIDAGFTLFGKQHFPGEDKTIGEQFPRELKAATEALKPVVASERVTLQMREPAALGALAGLALVLEQHSGGEGHGNNLKQILIALHNYHSAKGSFPAHALYSKQGNPLLSWRVALLPYLEQEQLYKEFHLDEPWDSDHNKKLIDKMPKVYRSPKIKDARLGLTTYVVPINKAFIFTSSDKGAKIQDITDGTSNTAMLVDVADETGVLWTKPDDLLVNVKDPWKGLLGHYPTSILVGMADGSVRRVWKKVSGQTLWALFTRDGGEVLPDLSK